MRNVISLEKLTEVVPSIFAKSGAGFVSDNYRHIATVDVVSGLMNEGFYPTLAKQQNTRKEEKKGFQKHMLRFTHENYLDNAEEEFHPEIVLINSHDRSSAYHLYFGIFRLVCMNGMIVCTSDLGGITVRHSGKIVSNVIDASYKLIDEAPAVQAQIDSFKSFEMTPQNKLDFAEEASFWKWGKEERVEPSVLLQARRMEDNQDNLWCTLNIVQENLFKGGMSYTIRSHDKLKNRKSRAIKGVNETVMLNQKLWSLADRYLEEAI